MDMAWQEQNIYVTNYHARICEVQILGAILSNVLASCALFYYHGPGPGLAREEFLPRIGRRAHRL
jgi:hypothetical protein